jgi:ABC-type Zn uptake system ZnuABC Zn-binding protein ZnuA
MIGRRVLLGATAAGVAHLARPPAAVAAGSGDGTIVVAALAPVFTIATSILAGTGIRVLAVPSALPGMARIARGLARPTKEAAARLAHAAAVLTISGAWAADPLFREARTRNIRVVEIDASRSLDPGGPAVVEIRRPETDVPWLRRSRTATLSPHVWTSAANCMRMADILARDLARLSPGNGPAIMANLAATTAGLAAIKVRAEEAFAGLASPHLLSLTDRFPYLLDELAVDVDAHFLEEDARWTAEDHRAIAAFITTRGIRTVLHHWRPTDAVTETIRSAGASLLVLEDGDTWEGSAVVDRTPPHVVDLLRANVDALHGALS